MNPFQRKSKMRKMIESLESNGTLKAAAMRAAESVVADATSRHQAEKIGKALRSLDTPKASGRAKKVAKSGLMLAAGTAAAVAASASISSHRRHESTA
jgi:hypothetical protein